MNVVNPEPLPDELLQPHPRRLPPETPRYDEILALHEAAIGLGRNYYLMHARTAFGVMGADQQSKDAARVVGWLAALDFGTLKLWKGRDK